MSFMERKIKEIRKVNRIVIQILKDERARANDGGLLISVMDKLYDFRISGIQLSEAVSSNQIEAIINNLEEDYPEEF